MSSWMQLLGGGLLLFFGAEWFVGGASALALALRVPQLVVGLTVVAYGTSAPEVIVGVKASWSGHGDVALGNVLGSNIANVGLILGVAALIRPAAVHGSLRERELPVLTLSAGGVLLVLANGLLARWEGALLLATALGYTGWLVRASMSARDVAAAHAEATVTADAADAAGAPRTRGPLASAGIAVLGLAVLLVGGSLFVDGAVAVARGLGISDRVVGLTVVAVGTSLPELVTSCIAAARGHSDIAVGNVVGSNIFNVLLCLGGAALVSPITAAPVEIAVDLAAFVLMTGVAAALMRRERVISRFEGGVALALYVAYTAYVVSGS